jgi:hypothetical protein
VLVDHRGTHVAHLRPAGEAVDDEGVQAVGVGHREVQQEVLGAAGDEDPDGLGQRGGPAAEPLDVRPGRRADPDRHEGLHGASDRGEVDLEPRTGDHAPVPQRPGPVEGRGRRDPDGRGHVPVGPPCVDLQRGQDRRV